MSRFALGPELLAEAGYTNLTRKQVDECLKDVYQTLELRVGEQMARKLTRLQLSEFEKLIDEDEDEPASRWLAKNVPDYREIVGEEMALIKNRLSAAADARRRRSAD